MTKHNKAKPLALACLSAAIGFAGAGQLSAQTTVQLLHASDLEGGVNAVTDAPNFAAIVQALESDAAASGTPSLLLSAGDNYIPGPFFSAAGDPSVRDELRQAYDTLFGFPAGTVNDLREGVGRVDVSVMNLIGFDASALGNHEFDAGTGIIREIIGTDIRAGGQVRWLGAQFPYLGANLDFSGDGALAGLFTDAILENTAFASTPADLTAAVAAPKLAPYTKITRGGEVFGVVGATTPLLRSISSPGDTEVKEPGAGSNDMADLAAILQPRINALLADGVDKIILVSHLQQIALEEELIGLLNGVDIVVAGGSDTLLANPGNRLRAGDSADAEYPLLTTNKDGDPALIVSTDGEYSYVGRLVVSFDANGRITGVDTAVSGPYATDDEGVEDLWGNLVDPFQPGTKGGEVALLTAAVADVVISKDGLVYGKTDVFLEGRRAEVRTEETNLGDMTADANLAAARAIDADVLVSIKNGGGIRAEIGAIDGLTGEELPPQANPASGKEEGEVSQLDIENSLRFNNGLSLLTVSANGLHEVLEHAVAASGPGATPGQFPQVGGIAFSFDTAAAAGARIVSAAIKDAAGNTLDVLVENGVVVGDPDRPIRMVTLGFLADGGDGYPFPALGVNRVDTGINEQDALADYLINNHAEDPFAMKDAGPGMDGRIQNLAFRSDTANQPPVVSENALQLSLLGTYETGVFDEGAAEIAAYDAKSRRVFFVNADAATVDILDIADPANPTLVGTIDVEARFGGGGIESSPNSVDVKDGLVAVAIARFAGPDEIPVRGVVAFYDVYGNFITDVTAGYGPDMLTFTPNGRDVVVANEGEPNSDYSIDPEGSVSIINVGPVKLQQHFRHLRRHLWWLPQPFAREVDFRRLNRYETALKRAGVRIFGPNATVAQDLEPEYIVVSDDSRRAYVGVQENNAILTIDLRWGWIERVNPLGTKDFSLSGLDASDRDDAINIVPWPVKGFYLPDAISGFKTKGRTYLVTANEGDARDYDGFAEEERVKDIELDPAVFPDADDLQQNAALGRLTITTTHGDADGDGLFEELYTLGGRSFTIWEVNRWGLLEKVYDSGADFEQIVAALDPLNFNSNNDENDTFDSRSDNKGPEPEAVTVAKIKGRHYAFIGLERQGGIMVYDVTEPDAPVFLQYLNNRDFAGDAEAGTAGDLGPEGLKFIPASQSPTKRPLLVVGNEVSGTVSLYQFE